MLSSCPTKYVQKIIPRENNNFQVLTYIVSEYTSSSLTMAIHPITKKLIVSLPQFVKTRNLLPSIVFVYLNFVQNLSYISLYGLTFVSHTPRRNFNNTRKTMIFEELSFPVETCKIRAFIGKEKSKVLYLVRRYLNNIKFMIIMKIRHCLTK